MSKSTELSKWSDGFMFRAEDSVAADGPSAYLLGAPSDPLAQIAACAKMYLGEVVRDLSEVTNEEREKYLTEIQKTALKMPLEAVSMHFMVEGVTRGFTHQMVRQRTAAFAQESTRFAVKEDMKQATALPPSLEKTVSLAELVEQDLAQRIALGLEVPNSQGWDMETDEAELWFDEHRDNVKISAMSKGGAQASRLRWDDAVDGISQAYLSMVNDGIAAEDARGLLPTNITTRLNYITNLRSFYDTMAMRVSDQAQFEWRKVAMFMALAMMEYGKGQRYNTKISEQEYKRWDASGKYGPILARKIVGDEVVVTLSSEWQYKALANEIKPIEFSLGRRAFAASFDRPSRIGERVDAFAHCGVPSSQWTQGSPENNIPPIHPSEWLLDPESARLNSDQEFDIFGNRTPRGSAAHWDKNTRKIRVPNMSDGLYNLDEIGSD